MEVNQSCTQDRLNNNMDTVTYPAYAFIAPISTHLSLYVLVCPSSQQHLDNLKMTIPSPTCQNEGSETILRTSRRIREVRRLAGGWESHVVKYITPPFSIACANVPTWLVTLRSARAATSTLTTSRCLPRQAAMRAVDPFCEAGGSKKKE